MNDFPNSQMRINPDHINIISCSSCDGKMFITLTTIGKISKLQSPTGEDMIIPVGEQLVCAKCGTPLEENNNIAEPNEESDNNKQNKISNIISFEDTHD